MDRFGAGSLFFFANSSLRRARAIIVTSCKVATYCNGLELCFFAMFSRDWFSPQFAERA